jgi:methyl-accepting chemotaxis protein WspA
MFLGNLKIGTRLALAFAVLLTVTLGITGFAIWRLDLQDMSLTRFANNHVPQLVTGHKWAISILESGRHMRNIFILDHDKIPEELANLVEETKLRIVYMNALSKTADTDQGKEMVQHVVDTRAKYIPDEDEFIKLAAANQLDEAKRLFIEAARPEQLAYLTEIYKLIDYQLSLAAKDRKAATEGYDNGRLIILTSLCLAVMLAFGLGYWLLRAVSGPLSQLIQVTTSVTEIAATAKEQQTTASEIAATTMEIGATSREISATSKELVRTMNEVAGGAEQLAALAGNGQTGLTHMGDTMRHIMEAAGAINAKLGVLNEKAGNINQIVTTITKVADQTNLLSLNAAIEAEKAGEHGRGFGVVATEIRRLSDQTAVATYDIEQTVKDIHSAVSASVMGMDKFSEEVRRGMQDVQQVGDQLSQIIQQVQALVPRVESVNDGMQAQATSAEQITQALGQLSEAVQQTVDSLRQSSLAINGLNQVISGLSGGVTRLRLVI